MRLIAGLLVVGITACGDQSQPDTTGEAAGDSVPVAAGAGQEEATPAQDSVRDAFVERGLALTPDALQDLVKRAKPPDSTTVESKPNRHEPGRTDTLSVLHYPGIRISVHKAGGSEFVTEALVTDSRYLAPPVKIGMEWSEVVRLFGPSLESESGEPRYSCVSCDGAVEPVFFVVTGGRVTGVRFTFYVD